MRKLTQDDFLERSKAVHGDRYDYSRSVYVDIKTKVEIGCRVCGHWFRQNAQAHFQQASGCPRCKGARLREHFALSQVEFEARVKAHHGASLDLSKAFYRSSEKAVDVRCVVCDLWFRPWPMTLMRGSGCPRCASVLKMTHDDFLRRAREIHGDCYEYLTPYVLSVKPIRMRCRKCEHVFEQTPNSHLNCESDCPRCFHRISEAEITWLDELGISQEHRQSSIPEFRDNRFKADALVDRTVYEFYGSYYHGDPRKYARDVVNDKCALTMGELYDATIERYEKLISFGYLVRFVWEFDRDRGLLFSDKHPTYGS